MSGLGPSHLTQVKLAAPVPGMVRRTWRSPIARCDWESEPFVPREVVPREHPIAMLGTDPEAMRAAHEYCAAMLARAGGPGDGS